MPRLIAGRGLSSRAMWSVARGDTAVDPSTALDFPGLPNAWTVPGGVTELINEDFNPTHYTGTLGQTNGVGVKAREDAGPAWTLRGTPGSTLWHEATDLDPWLGLGKLRCDYTGSGNIARMIDHPNSPFAASATGLDSLIWQIAWKFSGTGGSGFLGKSIDLGTGQAPGGVIHRLTAEAWGDPRLGLASAGSCDADTDVCSVEYDDNGATPVFPANDPPGSATTWGDVGFSIRQDANLTWWWKPNMNHSVAPPGTNAANFVDNAWRLDTWRWTRSSEAGSDYGRLELWRTSAAGVTHKLMEYLGDTGERFAGKVTTWPTGSTWTMNTANGPFGYTGQGYSSSDLFVHLGGYCVLGHPRLAL